MTTNFLSGLVMFTFLLLIILVRVHNYVHKSLSVPSGNYRCLPEIDDHIHDSSRNKLRLWGLLPEPVLLPAPRALVLDGIRRAHGIDLNTAAILNPPRARPVWLTERYWSLFDDSAYESLLKYL